MEQGGDIPALRFKGFQGEWEEKKLEELAERTCGGGTPSTANEQFWNGNIPWIQSSDLLEGKVVDVNPRKYISQEALNQSATQLVPEKSLAIVTRVGVGKLAFIPFAYATSQDFLSLSQLKTEPLFTSYACYKKLQAEIHAVQGTSIKGITKEDLLSKSILVPSYHEQAQIGSMFQYLDQLIFLQQQKLDKLEDFKKAMLERMFPQKGSRVPEIRFQGFTELWEEKKLGECFTERIESMPDGELLSVTLRDGIKKFSELGRHDNSNEDKSKYKKVCKGDIAYNSMRMWQGASGYSSYEGIVSPAYTVLVAQPNICSRYVAYQFKSPHMIHEFQLNSQGITSDNWNLKFPTLREITIVIAKEIQEQKKIANYFSQLDRLLSLHRQKLEKLQAFKKAMLGQMFPPERTAKSPSTLLTPALDPDTL